MKKRVLKVRKVKKVRKNAEQRTAVFQKLLERNLTTLRMINEYLKSEKIKEMTQLEHQDFLEWYTSQWLNESDPIDETTVDENKEVAEIVDFFQQDSAPQSEDVDSTVEMEIEDDPFEGEDDDVAFLEDEEDVDDTVIVETPRKRTATATTQKIQFTEPKKEKVTPVAEKSISQDTNLSQGIEAQPADTERQLQLTRIFNESQQKEDFYESQTKSSNYLKRFKDFIQFLPTSKAEGFRTLPLPTVASFGTWVNGVDADNFKTIFGKEKSGNVNGEDWKFLTAQYGSPIGSTSGKAAGIGTILVYVRRNGHTQMFIPSTTPMIGRDANVRNWSPSAEFVSRPNLAFWGSDSEEVISELGLKSTDDKDLATLLSTYVKKRQFGSYPQMLMYIQSWRGQNTRAIQKRSVMPVLVFKETSNNIPKFVKVFRGSSSRLAVNIDAMISEGNVEEQSVDFSVDSLNSDLRKLIQMANEEVRNNPMFKNRIQKRVRKRRKRK